MSRFFCPHCDKKFRWSSAIAGKKGRCKACGKPMRVPLEGSESSRPDPSDADIEVEIDEPSPLEHSRPRRRESGSRAVSSAPSTGPRRVRENEPRQATPVKEASKKKEASPSRTMAITATSVLSVVVALFLFGAKVYRRYEADQARAEERKAAQHANQTHFPPASIEAPQSPEILEPKSPQPRLTRPGENREGAVAAGNSAAQTPAITPIEERLPVADKPQETPKDLNAGETLFQLSEAVMVEQRRTAFDLAGGAPDFSISVKYRIKPVDHVLNVHVYRLNLRIGDQDTPVGFGQTLAREGVVQTGFRSFGGGLDRRIVGEVQAWVEKIDPDNTASIARVSNVVTLARAGALPQPPPPPLEDPNVPPLKLDTTLPPAMQARKDEFEKQQREKERPFEKDEIEAGLAQMASERDQFKVREQLKRLQKTPPDKSHQERVDETLSKVLAKGDGFTVKEVLAAWRLWESGRMRAALIEALPTDDHFAQAEIIKTIGELKISEAAEKLVSLANRSGHDHDIEKALVEIGSSAEMEVAKLLDSDERDDKRLALNVLKEIGTKKSLSEVVRLTRDDDPFVRSAAENAAREMKGRK